MLHLDGCGLKRAEVPGLVEALQASVWCLHLTRPLTLTLPLP